MPSGVSMSKVGDAIPRFMPDTNCIIALLLPGHERHELVSREFERRLNGGEVLTLAAPVLLETYSVLTRLPTPHRLTPIDCRALLNVNFLHETIDAVALSADGYRRLIQDAPDLGVAGGRIYDAVIAGCARLTQVETLLTFNTRHFAQFAGKDLAIVAPS